MMLPVEKPVSLSICIRCLTIMTNLLQYAHLDVATGAVFRLQKNYSPPGDELMEDVVLARGEIDREKKNRLLNTSHEIGTILRI